MILHAPVQLQIGEEVQLSVQVELASKKKRDLPRELWFRFPIRFQSQLSLELDPFVVALVLLAMKNREPILLQGSISEKLYHGLEEYQQIYHSWYPEIFHRIEIQPLSLRNDTENKYGAFRGQEGRGFPRLDDAGASACAFSGGVDSFYTLLSLMNPNRKTLPPFRYALFMAGFDMPLHLTQSIAELTRSYAVMMKGLGVEFVVGSTNIRKFVNTVAWTNAHGQALAAAALFFKDSWENFYIPSSYASGSHPKWGTHPSLDPLLSTESLKFIHHGIEANRVNKLSLISTYSETYDRLRVCWIQDLGLKNCGECEKCIRTMIALALQDKLFHYTTFEGEALNFRKIRNLKMRTHQARIFAQELIIEAAKRFKLGICLNLGFALLRRAVFHKKVKWRKRLAAK